MIYEGLGGAGGFESIIYCVWRSHALPVETTVDNTKKYINKKYIEVKSLNCFFFNF